MLNNWKCHSSMNTAACLLNHLIFTPCICAAWVQQARALIAVPISTDKAWYWLKHILCSRWLCITPAFFIEGDVVHWLFMHANRASYGTDALLCLSLGISFPSSIMKPQQVGQHKIVWLCDVNETVILSGSVIIKATIFFFTFILVWLYNAILNMYMQILMSGMKLWLVWLKCSWIRY